MTKTEYFIEIVGAEPEDITSVLIGCVECGDREITLDVARAKHWRAEHHKDRHTGGYFMEFTEDDPYNESFRFKEVYREKKSPVQDLIAQTVQSDYMSVPDIAIHIGKDERSIRTLLATMSKNGLVTKTQVPMDGRKPQVRYMARC
ncbi:hypothetical protein [Arthrobacter sp. BF1]|uniref:hypothetical protein n=1 Tax=Arthrobacter sp. BF1 TaxID=2821145 RepID=UPI001C4E945E|nr:hypothetical protein [Arthrobacter sp. BF1]